MTKWCIDYIINLGDKMIEEWKQINNFENYEISNLGNVRNFKTKKIISKQKMGNYLTTKLYNIKTKKMKLQNIHRLVAETFIENKENKKCVNHKDGNKLNNSVNNLEWVSYQENTKHAFENGLQKSWFGTKFGKEHPNYKFRGKWKTQINVYQYDKNGKFIKKYNSATEAERILNISCPHIIECCKGKRKTAGGYIWKREENIDGKLEKEK